MPELPLTQMAHQQLGSIIKPGDTVIDATVGNGHDTLFLAQKVGPSGKVYGFDIQQSALDICFNRLQTNNADKQVALFHAGHESMPILIPAEFHLQKIKAVMFNLGYLPGGDKSRRTHTTTTLSALGFALQALCAGGTISILAYTGHAGGNDECNAIKDWLSTLDKQLYNISMQKPVNTLNAPPELILVTKNQTG